MLSGDLPLRGIRGNCEFGPRSKEHVTFFKHHFDFGTHEQDAPNKNQKPFGRYGVKHFETLFKQSTAGCVR